MRLKIPPALKRVTNPLFGQLRFPIPTGVNKGAWWSVAAAGGGYGTGKREPKQMQIVTALIRGGDTVWDLGAHFGYITIAAARCVGTQGRVCAFEPSKSNRWFLQNHVRWNRLHNTHVFGYAIGGEDGSTRFGGGATSKLHKLGGGNELVEIRTIPTLLRDGAPLPTFLKIDVEGAEAEVLRGGLSNLRPDTRMLIEVHNANAYDECADMLRRAGYSIADSERVRRYKNSRWGGGADIAAFGPLWHDTTRDMQMLQEIGF